MVSDVLNFIYSEPRSTINAEACQESNEVEKAAHHEHDALVNDEDVGGEQHETSDDVEWEPEPSHYTGSAVFWNDLSSQTCNGWEVCSDGSLKTEK